MRAIPKTAIAVSLICLFFGHQAQAQYTFIDTDLSAHEKVFINTSTIEKNGNIATVILLQDFQSTVKLANIFYLSAKSVFEFNCTANTYVINRRKLYAGNMLSGTMVYEYVSQDGEDYIPSAGPLNKIKAMVCR